MALDLLDRCVSGTPLKQESWCVRTELLEHWQQMLQSRISCHRPVSTPR